MINIYLENTTDFNNNGLGILKDCISANVTAEINGEFSLSIPLLHPQSKSIAVVTIDAINFIRIFTTSYSLKDLNYVNPSQ